MNDEPGLVSIVTPCHNAAPFIAETIESVMAQTYPKLEHIVVDDGSTDESWAVISSFGSHLTTVRLEHNRGGSYARNRGAALAKGDFLMFLDADDVLAPGAIAALVTAVRERPVSVAACPWKRLKQGSDGVWVHAPADVPLPDGDPLAGWLAAERWVPPCAILWRRDAYERARRWDESISANDDGDIMMRAFLAGVRLIVAADGESYYRWHGYTRVSLGRASFTEAWFRSHMRVLEKVTGELLSRGDLALYARPLGIAYHKLALLGFQRGQSAVARECLRRGTQYAGPFDHSRTRFGRLLTRVIGLEHKEQLAGWLAERGAMTEMRRRSLALRACHLRDLRQQARERQQSAAQLPAEDGQRDFTSASPATTEEPTPLRVTIAVVTYRRPVGLARLLNALSRLEFTKVKAPTCTVLVVDNDADGSAATVCDREQEGLPWPLTYVHEPRRGISQARNAAVRHGTAAADWLAFIDDDEIPEPCWLDELLHVQRTYAADIVAGAVVPMFEQPAARWIMQGDFFALPRYATGTRLDRAYTCNVLVSARVFREMLDQFDERLGLSGGEDVQFFRRAAGRGYRLVWADDALAHDCIPASRVTAGWLLRRAYRTGNIWGVCDRDLEMSAGIIAQHTARAIARIAKGLLLVSPSLLFGRHVALKAARTAALGAGYLAGVVRLRYDEYRTTHGV